MSRPWTQEEFTLALQMFERGDDNAAFVEKFGKTRKAVEARRDRLRNGGMPRVRGKNRAEALGLGVGNRASVSTQAIKEARLRAMAPRSLTAAIFGDPPEGYSALDRRRSA